MSEKDENKRQQTVGSDSNEGLGLPPLEQVMLDRLKLAHYISWGSTRGGESAALNRLVQKGFAKRIQEKYGHRWELA